MKTKSWSNSALALYEKCAFKYRAVKINGVPEEPSKYLIEGRAVHNIAEQFLLGKIEEVPFKLSKFTREFKKLRELGAIPEEEIVFDSSWNHIPNGWQHENAWLRMKLDARIGNYIVDFKTGRHYDEHIQQARLYANAHMLRSGGNEVDVEFWYLNSGQVSSYTFYRRDLEKDQEDWQFRVDKMHNDTEFKPTENPYCKYCIVKSTCPLWKN